MRTTASLFTGGAIFETGAMMAGLKPVWGVEIVPEVADVAERNIPGLSVIRSDVADVDYSTLPKVDHLHASPSCKNASSAKNDAAEATEDIEAARAICRALAAIQPVAFTLENVYAYRNFDAFRLVLGTLHELGYTFDYWHLNAADYGVAQTRKRLIPIARRDGKPAAMPRPTHAENPPPQLDMFGGEFGLKRWVGWYEAIEDLIPGLPDSEFASWQLARLPTEIKSVLLAQGGYDGEVVRREASEPAFTMTANSNQSGTKAFLAPINGEFTDGFYDSEPAQAIAANHSSNKYRAFIIPGDNSGNGVIRQASEPMNTVQTRTPERCPHRAFVGRVVKMTPRVLARLQSIPDTYWLPIPKQTGLACTIIGNGVPSLLARAICESLEL